MHTRTPAPLAPPHAHSLVTCPGQASGSAIRSTASAGRLQAGSGSSIREEGTAIARLEVEVFPQSPQEIARGRHADLIREATQERFAADVREGAPARPSRLRGWALHWAQVVRRRPAGRA